MQAEYTDNSGIGLWPDADDKLIINPRFLLAIAGKTILVICNTCNNENLTTDYELKTFFQYQQSVKSVYM